jgi:hypothetical protein
MGKIRKMMFMALMILLNLSLIISGFEIRAQDKVMDYETYKKDRALDRLPFQVLYNSSASTGKYRIPMNQDQLLSLEDSIHIENGGYVLMAHYTGFLFEFYGDTIISVRQLNEHLSNEINLTLSKKGLRANFTKLFERTRLSQGAVSGSGRSSIQLILQSRSLKISKNSPVISLSWIDHQHPKAIRKYRVIIKSIFDETVDILYTDQRCVTIDFSRYTNDPPLFLIRIEDVKDPNLTSSEIGISVGSQSHYFPQTWDPNTAVQALEIAFYFENTYQYGGSKYLKNEAAFYYNLADKLSDQPIYTTFLNNFKARNGIE